MMDNFLEVIIENIPVLYIEADGGVKDSAVAFNRLESKLPTLKQKKFYGALLGQPENGVYRACVRMARGDNPAQMGLETWVIPGGKYARAKIKDWESNLASIGATFVAMMERYPVDLSRPSLEFYRSQEELILLLPVI